MGRDVVNYENYFIGNKWRMQGVNTATTFQFMQGVEKLSLQLYGTRLLASDLLTIPDRFLYGSRLNLVQSDVFSCSGNVVGISDIVGTVDSSEVDYDNNVFTGDVNLKLIRKEDFKIHLLGEAGISLTALREDISSTNISKSDYFFDAGIKMLYAPKYSFGVQLNYRDVGPDFNSPAAQTRRIVEGSGDYTLESFPHFNDGATLRSMSMLDRLTQEYGIYTGGISTVLMEYLPQYNNMEPYGQATPNRKGASAIMSFKDSLEIISVTVKTDMLSEIYSAGDTATRAHRDFFSVKGGVVYHFNKTMGWEKSVVAKIGGKYESTLREGAVPVDLQTISVDCGFSIETIDNLHVRFGGKILRSQGNEALPIMNRLNQVTTGMTPIMLDFTETLLGIGMQYQFSNTAYFSTQYILGNYDNSVVGQEQMSSLTHQWFFTFNISF